jgi:hypothetical protein
VVDVVLHETIHLLEKVGFLGMYRRISQFYGLEDIEGEGYWNAHLLVHEALVEALVPGGVLAPILGGDIRDFMTESARQRAAGRFRDADRTALAGYYVPLMQEYVGAEKRIDACLVERAVRMFNERQGEFAIGRSG